MALDRMTPPTDSLVAALSRVLLTELIIEEYHAEEVAERLAAAALEWIREHSPYPKTISDPDLNADQAWGYNRALRDLARRLGL